MTKTAFIAGYFDRLHIGHLHILREASKLGRLTVAINHDAYLARKGPGRPLDTAFARERKLYETSLVAHVVVIEDSPLDAIIALQPDYIVVGDDYTLDRVVGAEECKRWGGQVVIVPRIPGFSTTALVKAPATPDASLPPLDPDAPRREMVITIEVAADFEKRLDNQWMVEREIHADRWKWRWADET